MPELLPLRTGASLPVNAATIEGKLPESTGGEDLLSNPDSPVHVVSNVLHVEKLAARLENSLDLPETLCLVQDRAED